MPGGNRRFIESIQVLRAFAAFTIVLFHSGVVSFRIPFAVDLFFVISGFLMMYTSEERPRAFLFRRVLRMGPLYWLVTLLTYCILLFFPSLSLMSEARPDYLVKSLLFIPFTSPKGGDFPLVSVGWTVNYEIIFSVLFLVSFSISLRYRGLVAALLSVAGCGASLTALGGNFYFAYCFNDVILDFVLGIAAFYAVRFVDGRRVSAWVRWSCGAALAPLLYLLFAEPVAAVCPFRVVAAGLPCLILFLCFYVFSGDFKYDRRLVTIGDMSYSVYLVEYFTTAAFKLVPHESVALRLFAFAAMVFATYAVSYFSWKWIEKDFTRLVSSRVLGR